MVHTILLDAIHRGIDIAAAAVEVGGVNVDDEGLAAHVLGVNTCGIGQPVVCMDDVVLLLACDDASHDGVVVDFLVEVLRIAT